MKKWLFAVLFGSALVLGACGGGDDGASDDTSGDTGTEESTGSEEGGTVDTAAAEEVFQANCASCHGADLSGGAGPELTNVGSTHSADEIATIINEGQGTMPAGMATGDDVDLLANWLAEQK
ncbi:cytochrome C551 [Virgibacillus indicus]|uniref:Cytochrome C551 n=1 Tax=Virgibacillus indicus TaxID=2024554 RepID=A0A265N9U2_9BACI|nr:cytochrome c [Virgibacillus indicus]OZU88790.1 cytochrome C551 [Virgibacillus indicus]